MLAAVENVYTCYILIWYSMQKHYFVKKAMCMVQLVLGQIYLFCPAGIRLLHKERKIYILEKPMFAAVEK
jgi:hypothetical protein